MGNATSYDVQHLLSLCVGGGLGVFVSAPFTTALQRLQTGLPLWELRLSEFMRAVRSGLAVRMGWTGVEKMLKQLVEEKVRGSSDGVAVRIGSGACAGAAQALGCTSFEAYMLKRGLAPHIPALQVLREVAQAPMRGVGFCALRDIPFCAIVFPSVHYGSKKLEALGWSRATSNAIAGALCGATTAFLVTPADVFKTRLQAGLPLWDAKITVGSLYATAPLRFVRSFCVFGAFFAGSEIFKERARNKASERGA